MGESRESSDEDVQLSDIRKSAVRKLEFGNRAIEFSAAKDGKIVSTEVNIPKSDLFKASEDSCALEESEMGPGSHFVARRNLCKDRDP